MPTPLRANAVASVLATAMLVASPAGAAIVQNGSFETLEGPFFDNGANYMEVFDGFTFISGWTVSSSLGAPIVLGRTPTDDGYSAADGTYFVDLSGFGDSSLDGALSQTIHTSAGA